MSARLSIDHPPLGGRALKHLSNFCNHAQWSIVIITFLLHHGNQGLWRAPPKETGTKSRSGSAPRQAARLRQRQRGRAGASTCQVRGFFLKSRPPSGRPSSGARPSDRSRVVAAPCCGGGGGGGRCPSASATHYSCCCNKCKIPVS